VSDIRLNMLAKARLDISLNKDNGAKTNVANGTLIRALNHILLVTSEDTPTELQTYAARVLRRI
jgi:hypothetical protein